MNSFFRIEQCKGNKCYAGDMIGETCVTAREIYTTYQPEDF